MNSDFFKGFLAARGVKLPDASLDMNQYEEALTDVVRKHIAELDQQITGLTAQLQAANQKLSQAGAGQVPVATSATLGNSVDAESARLALGAEARRLEATGMNYPQAFAAARALRPDLAQRALARPVLANALETIPEFPGKKPEIVKALGLTMEADLQVFQAAWTATRGKTDPADSLAIFRVVRAWLAGFNHTTLEQAEDGIEQEFPALFAAAKKQLTTTLENTIAAHPGAKLMLGIPAAVSLDEFAAALEGNGGMVSPRNARGIWEALLKWLAKERGRGTAGVEREAAQRYPDLAQALSLHPV